MKGESKEETLTSCQAQKRSREVWALKAASTWPDTGGAPTQLGLPGSPSWPPCMEQGCVPDSGPAVSDPLSHVISHPSEEGDTAVRG